MPKTFWTIAVRRPHSDVDLWVGTYWRSERLYTTNHKTVLTWSNAELHRVWFQWWHDTGLRARRRARTVPPPPVIRSIRHQRPPTHEDLSSHGRLVLVRMDPDPLTLEDDQDP